MEIKKPGLGNDLRLLPPLEVGRWRLYERLALKLRSFVGINLNTKLDPFALAMSIGARVVYLNDLTELSESSRVRLNAVDGWSGGATQDLGDGSFVIVLNHRHSSGRQAATLMEEVCHILFGHRPSGIVPTRLGGRSYNFKVEEEAYAVGAATLVPYHSLRNLLISGVSIRGIASHFGVTPSLVLYRAKGLHLDTFLS